MSDTGTGTVAVRGARRLMIIVVVASLTVAALLGIVALVGGEFGELQVRVVFTTLTVAAFGTTALCHLAVVTRAVRVVGFLGLAASLGAAVCALELIWIEPTTGYDGWLKALVVLTVAAVSLAHTNLLLLLSGRADRAIRAGLGVTLAAIAVVAVMIAIPVLTDGDVPGPDGDGYWRWMGVAGILDALGTIALPVLGLLRRRGPGRSASDHPDPVAEPTGPTVGPGTAAQPDGAAGPDSTAAPNGTAPGDAAVRLVLDLPTGLAARLDARAGAGSREAAALAVLERGLRTG